MSSVDPRFELLLKNEKLPQYDRMAVLFILLNLGYIIYLGLSSTFFLPRMTAFFCTIIVLTLLSAQFFLSKEKTKFRALLLLSAGATISIGWILLQQWWLLFLSLAMVFLYMISRRKLSVRINKEFITYPSFPERTVAWKDLNTVILKDGLLTMNFSNNRFIQQPVDVTETPVNEPEFNEFCRQQLVS